MLKMLEVFNVGELSLVCKHCEAKHFSTEKSDDGEFVHFYHKDCALEFWKEEGGVVQKSSVV